MTPEGKVKKWMKDTLKAELPDVYLYHPPGGRFGRNGTPDTFGLWHGVFFSIEAKAEAGMEPTALQMKNLRHISRQGGVAATLCGKDHAKLQLIISTIKKKAEEYAASSV